MQTEIPHLPDSRSMTG